MIFLSDWLESTHTQVLGPTHAQQFSDFCFDSRIVQPGQLFLAVRTETGDGHDHIQAACLGGASGVVCERPPIIPLPGVTCIQVKDTLDALLAYARHMLRARRRQVIGVTGSVGKTSTKEALVAVLGQRQPTFGNYGNYNGRYGLPIALGRLEPEHTLIVLEMAADSLGEIRALAEIARPTIAVITAVGHSHTLVFGSLQGVAEEKQALIEALPPDGLALLNADDPWVAAMASATQAQVLTFGHSPAADIRCSQVQVSLTGTRMICHTQAHAAPLTIPLLGPQHAYTALAAAGVGRRMGLDWPEIQAGLDTLAPLPGRTRLLNGVHGARILDDSYNASPESALAALDLLAALPGSRRIVLLGDMAELGNYAETGHRQVGRRLAEVADLLVAKGELAALAADEALAAGMSADRVQVVYSGSDVVRLLSNLLQPDDLLLVKGSATARLEQITAELLAPDMVAEQVLPRQHRGWHQVRIEQPGRPTWVEIDLDAIAENTRTLKALVGQDVELMAVLKADAYGHGAIKVARTALINGASWLGVACLGEAIVLRQAGITAPILNLGYTPPWQARDAVLHQVTCVVYAQELAQALDRAGRDLCLTARAHLKIDTGMGRLGTLPQDALPLIEAVADLAHLDVNGIMTHFSAADDRDLGYTRWQLARFESIIDQLAQAGHTFEHRHAANSAALLRLPASHLSMVRPGIALYGLNPSPDAPCPEGIRPALSFYCQVAQVKELPAGAYVGYGRTYRTQRPTRIAVIPVGYADGFRRAPAHWGEVLVRGQRAPIVGRVCMDQSMLDVTHISGVRTGDQVVLIGSQGKETITVEDVAQRLGTVNYEVISAILARVPRIV